MYAKWQIIINEDEANILNKAYRFLDDILRNVKSREEGNLVLTTQENIVKILQLCELEKPKDSEFDE